MNVRLREPDDLDFELTTAAGPTTTPSAGEPSFSPLPEPVAQVLRGIPIDDVAAVTVHARALELSGIFAPPFAASPFAGGRVELISAGLRAVHPLLDHARQLADPRITNTALKLLGAALHGAELVPAGQRDDLKADQKVAVDAARANLATLEQQRYDVALASGGHRARLTLPPPSRRLLIIASPRSRAARRLRATLGEQAEVDWAIWTGPPPASDPALSYSQAFYPPATTSYDADEVAITGDEFTSFASLADAVAEVGYGAGLLVGMPVVPGSLLACFNGPVVNVHNGHVPTYRGMDAVAWALWNGDPVHVCAHVAQATVDSGPVLGEVLLETDDPGALRALVSQATHELLANAARDLVRSPGVEADHGRQATTRVGSLFRMHPILRRHLRARLATA